MGYRDAAQAVISTAQTVCPNGVPPWLQWGSIGLMLVATGAEMWTAHQLTTKDKEPSLHQQMAQYYFDKAAEMGKPVVNVHVHGTPEKPSNYLMKESGKDTGVDCFSCSSAHLASIKAGLDKMREHYQDENGCGDQCQAWGATALREGMALLSYDLTDEKISALPTDQQMVARKYQVQVSDLMDKLSQGDDQVKMLNQATGIIGESIRFANEGDTVQHPEVQDRLAKAEPLMAGAERFDITAFAPAVAQKLRSARQGTGNAGDLKEIYKGSQKVADQVTRPVIGRLRYQDIDAFAKQSDQIFKGYKADRQHHETKEQRRDALREGLLKYEQKVG